jgi:hypothetical protein
MVVRLAFVARTSDDRTSIWIREVGSVVPRALARTAGASRPFWSPDGRYLGFFANGKLKRLSSDGESVQTLTDAPDLAGGSRNRDSTIIFAAMRGRPISRISREGGAAAPVRPFDQGGDVEAQRYPVFLPDAQRFLCPRSLSSTTSEGRRVRNETAATRFRREFD